MKFWLTPEWASPSLRLENPTTFLYNKLKTRGDGEAVGVGVATPYFLQYSEGEARKGEAVKCANVPRPHFHKSISRSDSLC